jgi:hypothetical protein
MEIATKKHVMVCAILAWGLAAGIVAAAPSMPSDAWVGTWKLDPSKSKLAGFTVTYSKTPGGLYHFSDGGLDYDFGIDGKQYPVAYGRKTTWSVSGDRAWESETTADGKVLAKMHRELSVDGKTLKVTAEGTNADGSAFNELTVYKRVSGSAGLEGTWLAIKDDADAPSSFIVSAPTPGVLRWEVPAWQASTEGALDGSDHPIKGGTQPPGFTIGSRLKSPLKISYVMKIDGKPNQYGIQTLAADGRSFTDVSWIPGKENEKTVAWYVKQ